MVFLLNFKSHFSHKLINFGNSTDDLVSALHWCKPNASIDEDKSEKAKVNQM